jgi:hypothetical protein
MEAAIRITPEQSQACSSPIIAASSGAGSTPETIATALTRDAVGTGVPLRPWRTENHGRREDIERSPHGTGYKDSLGEFDAATPVIEGLAGVAAYTGIARIGIG